MVVVGYRREIEPAFDVPEKGVYVCRAVGQICVTVQIADERFVNRCGRIEFPLRCCKLAVRRVALYVNEIGKLRAPARRVVPFCDLFFGMRRFFSPSCIMPV